MPRVAICIPTYNQAAFLPFAVESARRQNYPGPLEIWVGDDASTDHTEEVLNQLTVTMPNLRVLRQANNVGIAANCSALMRQPSAEYLVRLDSDDALEPEYVSQLVAALRAFPHAGYAHSAVSQINESGETIKIRRLFRNTGYQDPETALRASLAGYRGVANILMFRREAIEDLDLYEGRPEFVEDYDLSVRIADSGYGNIYIDEPHARYRVWADAEGVRAKRKALQLDGYRRIFDEALSPAWERRGWSIHELARQRRKLALHHCPACFESQYTARECDHLIALLRRLGDSRRLRLWILFCQLGGAGWLERLSNLRYRIKALVKTVIKPVLRLGLS